MRKYQFGVHRGDYSARHTSVHGARALDVSGADPAATFVHAQSPRALVPRVACREMTDMCVV